MASFVDGEKLWTLFESHIDTDAMWKDAETISQWERYSGSPAGEAASEFIMRRLAENGLEAKCETYRAYRSLPVSSMVTLVSPLKGRKYAATACVYSADAKGLTGELYFDKDSLVDEYSLTPLQAKKRFKAFKNKIVLTYSMDSAIGVKAKDAGALALLRIWDFDTYHHWNIGDTWGVSGLDTLYRYHPLPVTELKKNDGEELRGLLDKGPVTVSLDVEMENKVIQTSMPIVDIKGKSDKFVLVSGHYDSWYNGMTDNGAANIMMIEMARIFKLLQKDLKRSVKLAWWSGHSDAKYSGSNFYFDEHWKELHDNCIAHIYIDIAGCKTSDQVRLRRTGMEGKEFGHDIVKKYTGEEAKPYVPMPRAADQSFFGSYHPISIMPRYEETAFFDEKGHMVRPHFYWWHTAADTLDKVSPEILLRDTNINGHLICRILNSEHIPCDIPFFISEIERFLKDIEKQLSKDFTLEQVYPYLNELKTSVAKLLKEGEGKDTDDIIKKVAGGLNHIVYSVTSKYENSPMTHNPVFSSLSLAKGVREENSDELYYIGLMSQFKRQRNRLIGELCCILDHIELQLLRWNKK